MTTKTIRRMCILAGMAVMSVSANAVPFDTHIVIDRALNSPTLTVRYSGAAVALVELKVNGVSLGTRNVSASKDNGETNFTLNLSGLRDGDNKVEVTLFDKAGKIVGTENTVISTDSGVNTGTVYLTSPKVGAQVQGPVEVKLGFGKELKNSFVSFFVNNQFKAMTNTPPYSFIWDTGRETNGWHEVEAWVVDSTSTTFKTRKVRVFVNNPSGRTDRVEPREVEPTTSKNPANPRIGSDHTNLKPVAGGTSTAAQTKLASAMPKTPGAVSPNKVDATELSPESGTKPQTMSPSVSTGPRFLTPTGTRVAAGPKTGGVGAQNVVEGGAGQIKGSKLPGATATGPVAIQTSPKLPKLPNANALRATNAAASTVAISKGQRFPNLSSLVIVYNSSVLNFDVNARIQDGIPLTPFRHLLEKAGGEVSWLSSSKSVEALADGKQIYLKIGDKYARINKLPVELELAPFLERGRTIVPLSFIKDTLSVDIDYDQATGHVLITSTKKK